VIGDAIAGAFHDAPRDMIRGDLRRFRQYAEAEETAAANVDAPDATGAEEGT
jgi:uncharacterized membrane protein